MNRSNTKYIDQFIRSKCASDMLALGLYPDAKEITESAGAYHAVVTYLQDADRQDPKWRIIAVGDGVAPRTGAMFAFRSRWTAWSVDPRLRERLTWNCINRLHIVRSKVENFRVSCKKAIVVAVHSHANLKAAVLAVDAPVVHVVAMGCCVPQDLPGVALCAEYDDPNVWSEKNTIKVWTDVKREDLSG